MNISLNVLKSEVVTSTSSVRLNLSNEPSESAMASIRSLCNNVYEPLSSANSKSKVRILNCYINEDLCIATGLNRSCQYAKGQAMDLDGSLGGMTTFDIFNYIKENLNFDVLVWEFGNNASPDWVRVSYVSKEKNKGLVLRSSKNKGRVVYETIG